MAIAYDNGQPTVRASATMPTLPRPFSSCAARMGPFEAGTRSWLCVLSPLQLVAVNTPVTCSLRPGTPIQVIYGGVKDLCVLKTTQSGYAGFGRCSLTTLPGAASSLQTSR